MPVDRPLAYERVHLPLCKVADTPFHIQEDEMFDASVHYILYMHL